METARRRSSHGGGSACFHAKSRAGAPARRTGARPTATGRTACAPCRAWNRSCRPCRETGRALLCALERERPFPGACGALFHPEAHRRSLCLGLLPAAQAPRTRFTSGFCRSTGWKAEECVFLDDLQGKRGRCNRLRHPRPPLHHRAGRRRLPEANRSA